MGLVIRGGGGSCGKTPQRKGEIPEREGSLIGLLCSRNARPRKALAWEKARLGALRVGWVRYRAQWETDSGHPPFEKSDCSP